MHRKLNIILILSMLLLSNALTGCSQFAAATFTETNTSYQKAEVLLEVSLPSPVAAEKKMQLEILDDVTGLPYNPLRIDMVQKDDRNYYAKTTFTVGSIVKYRYVKTSQDSSVEFNAKGQQVRFRILQVNGPMVVSDIIAAWQDEPYQGALGRIRGQFTDNKDNTPLPNLLVTAEGVQTITASDGSFILEGLTPGTHNLVVLALDGAYVEFQQNALIAEEATTPVFLSLEKRPLVDVSFEAKLPAGVDSNSTLRLATNFYSLGNLYADVFSGATALAADLPVLQPDSTGIYSIKISLPVGSYLTYKYTLGDGFWNGELNSDGSFQVREFIVPDKDTTLMNTIASFQPLNSGAIHIEVSVPSETPLEDSVSLQLNPYSWTAPLPMSKGDNKPWSFTLYNPQNYFGQMAFRFCRNTDCDLTKEAEPQAGNQIRSITPSAIAQTIQTTVEGWQFLAPATGATTVTTEAQGTPTRPEFLSGFEIDPASSVISRSNEAATYGSIAATGANWLILDPTWTATWVNPPLLEPVPGNDLLWPDILGSVQKAKQQNLAVAIFPKINFPNDSLAYWSTAQKDSGWWQSWFDRYHRFMIQNADAANLSGASAIILGDIGVIPAMGNGALSDGTPSNIPADADEQWRQLIRDIRSRFSGAIVGAVSLPNQASELPAWLDSVDALYLLIRPEVSPESVSSFTAIFGEVDAYFENDLSPLASQANKPILIGLNVASTTDSYLGCGATGVDCGQDSSTVGNTENIDLDLQAKILQRFHYERKRKIMDQRLLRAWSSSCRQFAGYV